MMLAAWLRAFHPNDDRLRQKALDFAVEIVLAPPVVSACGLVDVNLSLIPAVSVVLRYSKWIEYSLLITFNFIPTVYWNSPHLHHHPFPIQDFGCRALNNWNDNL